MEKKQERRERGITLVALVITIIVLLILAGVSIAMLTGENGILTQANEAKKKAEEAKEDEEYNLNRIEDIINEYANNAEITGIDTTITNPEGAMPEGATIILGNGNEGIVIRDENENEWVWVEVPKITEVYQTAGIDIDADNITDEQFNKIYEDLENYANTYRQEGFKDTFYSTEQHGFANSNDYNTAKNNMLKSIYKFGGFWIGRYEVGDADATASNTTRVATMGNTNKAVIKENQIPYNFITCKQAQELSIGLSTGGKTSSLMFGIQWDLTCKFLETKGGLTEEELKGGDGLGSTNWGNYKNSLIMLSKGKYNNVPYDISSQWLDVTQGIKSTTMLLTTGASDDTKKMNIYDFAGNVYECTLEYTSNIDSPCSARGGNYSNIGYDIIASFHSKISVKNNVSTLGFRSSLY